MAMLKNFKLFNILGKFCDVYANKNMKNISTTKYIHLLPFHNE